ncbi:MAG: leucyl/phenylalanyl-tRNA--protein transferase [Methylococcales bacterium]|nr:leucyl/phenylalanyl-tRNA--protein transferase [Methylococcales bacterium]
MKLTQLQSEFPDESFPPVSTALTDPDGLLAMGGCLSTTRLLNAYQSGIFPWFNPEDPILWWSPNPRLVLAPTELNLSRSLAKTIRQQRFNFTVDNAFSEVIEACSGVRNDSDDTWISEEMKQAYTKLHHQGIAHSAEAWQDGQLVGGLYGVAIGQVFFGESMFHTQTDASKVAFVHLLNHLHLWGYQLVDCQVHSNHLASLGAYEISRELFIQKLANFCKKSPHSEAWKKK